MGSRKEEERNEKIIRGLMKLPPNRRCINCNSLGPQYVCTNFWSFVCTTCSGIHREFTHRVKSVSMAKFTSQEVEALQNGGNQRAREIYLKNWDLQRQRLPDSSNVEKIRNFIKDVYVGQKYAGGKTSDKPPRDVQNRGICEDETRRASSYHSYSQSPPYDYQYEDRRYGKQAAALTRKPGSDRGRYEGKISSFVYSPGRLSDQMNDDRFANEGSISRVSDYSVSSGGDPFRSGTQSPNFQKDAGFNSPPFYHSRNASNEDMRRQAVDSFREMPRNAHWDDETIAHFLELIAESFSCRTSKTPSTPMYKLWEKKMCERFGAGEYTVDSLRSKYQRMKKRYRIYVKVSTNTGIGWDEESQSCTAAPEVIKDFAQGCGDTEKICKEGLANHHLYRAVYSRTVATGFYATASGGNRPPSTQMPFDESDDETEVETDISELPGPQSGDKRPSSSRQQAKPSRKKKGKMQQSAEETLQNMASIMTERLALGDHHVDAPRKDPFDWSACAAIVRAMDIDMETQYLACEFLRQQDRETKKAFVEFDPEFRRFWLIRTMGRQ